MSYFLFRVSFAKRSPLAIINKSEGLVMDKASSVFQSGLEFGLDAFNKVKDKIDAQRGTELEKKVKEATSLDNWGASSTLKEEISKATYDYEGYREVMKVLWMRMSESGKNWKVVFKSLELLDYMLRNG
jgi:hypothetical protein